MAQSTLTLDNDLHTIVKMIATAKHMPVSSLIEEFLKHGVARVLQEDPDLAQAIRTVLEREDVDGQQALYLLDQLGTD